MHSFFFCELQLTKVITFNSHFLYELKYKVHLSKAVCDIFHFRFRSAFVKVYIFVQQKAWILTLKCHNSFQNKNKRKSTHTFAPRPMDSEVATKSLKIPYLRKLELPKNWPGDEFFRFRKLKFSVRHFFPI